MRLRTSGGDDLGTIYTRQFIGASSTTVLAGRVATDTLWGGVGDQVSSNFRSAQLFEITNPFVSTFTAAYNLSPNNYQDSANITLGFNVFGTTSATSYTGFSILTTSGTMSGTVTVLGFKD